MVINMKVILKMINLKEKEYIIIIMNLGKMINMKGNGKMIKEKEKEYIIIIMVINMMVIGKII